MNPRAKRDEGLAPLEGARSGVFGHLLSPYTKSKNPLTGFTLVETLLTIAILATLLTVVTFTVHPIRQLSLSRDAHRKSDVHEIMNALKQYALDHEGVFPGNLTNELRVICRTGSGTCAGTYDLSELTDGQVYLVTVPIDPRCLTDDALCEENETGYLLARGEDGKIKVVAPHAENEEISLIR